MCVQVRIDSIVWLKWIDLRRGILIGESKLSSFYAVRVPKGTVIYEGPVGYQGGVYLGGQGPIQIFVPEPWNIPGLQVLAESPLP